MLFKAGDQGRAGSAASMPKLDAATKIPRFGVALLDFPTDEHSGGWAYAHGDTMPRRFSVLAELPNDAIWVTQNERVTPGRNVGRNVRPSHFLRTNLKQIAADLGDRLDGGPSAATAKMLGSLVHRAAMTAIAAYGWPNPMAALSAPTLTEDIRNTLQLDRPPTEIAAHIFAAYQSYSTVNMGGFATDMAFVNLRMNRLHFARKLLSYRAPAGSWHYRNIGGQYSGIDEWLDPNSPTLVEATIEFDDTDPEMILLMAIGNSPASRSAATSLRKWFTSVELSWIRRYARVHVNSVLINDQMLDLPPRMRLPSALVDEPLLAMSPAVGLVAESHWAAFAAPSYDSKSGTRSMINAQGVWVRAHDRRLCFERALVLHKRGFQVTGYGNGSIVVKCARPNLPALLDAADEIEAQYPVFSRVFEEHGIH